MLRPPVQTWFQLLPSLRDQPTLLVNCERPGVSPLLMMALRMVVRRVASQ